MTSPASWCTIESDPGVFTALLEELGTKHVSVNELVSLDDEELLRTSPAFGFVFLFKWTPEVDQRVYLSKEETDPDLFFAKQVVTNACATQALLSVVLNATKEVQVGTMLEQFREFSKEFDPTLRGELVRESEAIRKAHNAFARPEPFVIEDEFALVSQMEEEKEDAFHFVAYVPFKGFVYELDGLKPGPFRLGEIPVSMEDGTSDHSIAWMRVARPHIQARIEKYVGSEIRFNLMAVMKDRVIVHGEHLQALEETAAVAMSEGSNVSPELASEIERTRALLQDAEENKQRWAVENERRRHNYVPFVVATLKLLGKRKKLKGLVRAAQEKVQARERAFLEGNAATTSSSSS